MENEKKKKGPIGWLLCLAKKRGLTFLVGIVFALVCFIALNAMLVPTSTPEFCGTLCHEMDVAYESWKQSTHHLSSRGIQVKCIDCHAAPKEKYFTHLYDKATAGARDGYLHFFGGEFDVEKSSEKVLEHMKNETCLHCHNHLLDAPGNEMARELHLEVLQPEGDEAPAKCLECHEEVGHVR